MATHTLFYMLTVAFPRIVSLIKKTANLRCSISVDSLVGFMHLTDMTTGLKICGIEKITFPLLENFKTTCLNIFLVHCMRISPKHQMESVVGIAWIVRDILET